MKKDKKQNSTTAVDSNKNYNINYSVEELEKIQHEAESKHTKKPGSQSDANTDRNNNGRGGGR